VGRSGVGNGAPNMFTASVVSMCGPGEDGGLRLVPGHYSMLSKYYI
jgi:hypothetical protein